MRRALLAASIVFLLCSPAFGQEYVEVFVTFASFDGDAFGGLAGADDACTTAAGDAGLSGNWTAWLSDNTTDAVDRILDSEYRLLDGTVVANSLADLTDGTLDHPINIDETGTAIPGGAVEVWTSADSSGLRQQFGTCVNWTTNANTNTARIGLLNASDATWTDTGSNECDVFNRLYCFAAFEVPVEVEEFSVE